MYRFLIITLLILISFSETDSTCVNFTYLFQNKCYVFIKPLFIKYFRTTVWRDKRASDADASVIENKTMAERLCTELPRLSGKADLNLSPEENQEIDVIGQLSAVGEIYASIQVHLAKPRDRETLQWLKFKFYTYSNLRVMPKSFLDLSSDGQNFWQGESIKTPAPFSNGSWALLMSDPGRPGLDGLIFVDPEKPYRDGNHPVENKSQNIICQYDELADCQWIQLYPQDKCALFHGDECAIIKYAYKKEGHKLGAPCGSHANHTIECPQYKMSECNRPCGWGEWTFLKSACKPDCSGSEAWVRRVVNKSFPKDLSCTTTFQRRRCCSGCTSNRFRVSMGGMVLTALWRNMWI